MPTHPLLAPYTSSFPRYSLTLLTSVLGATGNWLVLRFLNDSLTSREGHEGLEGKEKRKVVLVSFLRGWEFWRGEGRRVVSLFSIFHLAACCFLFSVIFSFHFCGWKGDEEKVVSVDIKYIHGSTFHGRRRCIIKRRKKKYIHKHPGFFLEDSIARFPVKN